MDSISTTKQLHFIDHPKRVQHNQTPSISGRGDHVCQGPHQRKAGHLSTPSSRPRDRPAGKKIMPPRRMPREKFQCEENNCEQLASDHAKAVVDGRGGNRGLPTLLRVPHGGLGSQYIEPNVGVTGVGKRANRGRTDPICKATPRNKGIGRFGLPTPEVPGVRRGKT